MYEDAFKILKEGIRQHPNYTLGYIVLAHCYYDQEKYELTYNTLRPIIAQNADNISLQKVFAFACIHLGYLEEALETFKYLLFMNPKDKTFAEQVKKLEDDLFIGHKKLSLEQLIKSPMIDRETSQSPPDDDDWVQVDFNKGPSTPEKIEKPSLASHEDDQWVMKKPGLEDHPILKKEKIIERSLEDDFYADEFEEEHGDSEEVNAQSVPSDSPIISHTLIDLYCSQQYFDKAIELLDKILELNPTDEASLTKLVHVRDLKRAQKPGLKVVSEQDGHDELISIIESKVKAKSQTEIKLTNAFDSFLANLKTKSEEHR